MQNLFNPAIFLIIGDLIVQTDVIREAITSADFPESTIALRRLDNIQDYLVRAQVASEQGMAKEPKAVAQYLGGAKSDIVETAKLIHELPALQATLAHHHIHAMIDVYNVLNILLKARNTILMAENGDPYNDEDEGLPGPLREILRRLGRLDD